MWSLILASHSSGSSASKSREEGIHSRTVKHRLLPVKVDELLEEAGVSHEVGGDRARRLKFLVDMPVTPQAVV
jgi:hypothetical protein